MKKEQYSVYDIVYESIGSIQPGGLSHIDTHKLENLRELASLVDRLLFDISLVARLKDRKEHSIQKAGKFADQFLNDIKEA